jgi:hypothetical protein
MGECAKAEEARGLEVLDFEKFSRALRLRWLWFRWADPVLWGKPQLSHTNNERELKLKNQKPKCGTKDKQKLLSQQ